VSTHSAPGARRPILALFACAALATTARTTTAEDLAALSKRLQAGDRAAIGALLARTRPASSALADANARIERLRAEIEQLNARRAARPVFPYTDTRAESAAAPAQPGVVVRVDGLREARAWLRAGDGERALRAIPDRGSESLYLEARALETLGRRAEALVNYRTIANSAESATLRARAASAVEHLEWLERVLGGREGRP
jgi:hypothetical protein